MAKPFQRGDAWAFRLRIRGQDIFRTGFPSEAAARREMNHLRTELENTDKAQGLQKNGVKRTGSSLAKLHASPIV